MLGGAVASLVSGLGACEPPPAPGTLRIGSSPTGVPFSFVDPWSNRFTGAMIDTAQAVTDALHLAADFRVVTFSALIPSLMAGKIDMIAAALVRTPERARRVDFSAPVMRYAGAVVLPRGASDRVRTLADLRGLRVGAQVGTLFAEQLAQAGVREVATYDNLADILRDLANGRIAAGYGDAPILRYQLRVGPERPVQLARQFQPPAWQDLCLVLRRADPRLAQVNRAVAALRSRDLSQIINRWGV